MTMRYGPKNPTVEEMRSHALQKIEEATGHRLVQKWDRHSDLCYQVGPGGPYFHIFTNKPAIRAVRVNHLGNATQHRVYFHGNLAPVWDDPESVLVLQCGLDFSVVAPIPDWSCYRDRMGISQGGKRLEQHVHWDKPLVEIRERDGFLLNLEPWVDNFCLD